MTRKRGPLRKTVRLARFPAGAGTELEKQLAAWLVPSIPSSLPTPADVDNVPKRPSDRPVTARPTGQEISRGTYRKAPTCKE